jgi:hypothetical protein
MFSLRQSLQEDSVYLANIASLYIY